MNNDVNGLSSFIKDIDLFNALTLSTDDYIYLCNMRTGLFYFPKQMVEDFALPAQIIEDVTSAWGMRIHENERQSFFNDLNELIAGKTNIHFQEYRILDKNNNYVWLRCRGHVEVDEKGEPFLFAGIITNLGKKSKIDALTGLLNKFEFESSLKSALAKPHKSIGLILLGLDNFKYINNLYGWSFGDEVVRIVSQDLQTILPKGISLYRLDGDMFAVLLTNTCEDEVYKLYEFIAGKFAHQREYKENKYFCSLSAGFCITQQTEEMDFDTLYRRAQYALDYSKNHGKGRISDYNKNLIADKDRAMLLIECLRESVNDGFKDFELHFQPQVNALTREVKSAEALLRWKCISLGSISPVEFIPLLEQTGLIHSVGRWVIKQAAHKCAIWRKIHPNFVISVNLSYLQLLEEDFCEFLCNTIAFEGLPPYALHVELTESCIASGSQSLTDVFKKLRDGGIVIEMDDFGTGYSSLEILKNEPANVVKIDRAFVKNILFSEFDSTFIQFIVALCHSVNINVCLEGVETWDEYEVVRAMGLDLIQGYLFGHPQSSESFETQYILDNKNPCL